MRKSCANVNVSGLCAALLLCFSWWACAQGAQGYPSKPIRILVGFTPGGGPDITARYIAQRLTEGLRQQVIVDNRPGAGGTVAAQLLVNANPDGYTLLSVSSAHAVAATIYPKLPYDTLRDISGITQTALSKYVLIANPSLNTKTLKDLIGLARAKPGQLNFASAGVGSGTHFAGEQFKAAAGLDMVHVPFKGIPEAVSETLSGRVQLFMAPIANVIGMVKEGRVVGLGVSSPQRDTLLPGMPTLAEGGLAGFRADLWFGLLTSARVPRPVVVKLNVEVGRILGDAEVRARWSPVGLEPAPTAPAEFDRIIAREIAAFTAIARKANIKAN